MDIIDKLKNHLKQLAPHIKARESAELLTESLDEITSIRALLQNAEPVALLALNNSELNNRIKVLEDLLSSAYNIANRNGEGTHWARFVGQLHINGINPVTPKAFKILPSDDEYLHPPKDSTEPIVQCLKEIDKHIQDSHRNGQDGLCIVDGSMLSGMITNALYRASKDSSVKRDAELRLPNELFYRSDRYDNRGIRISYIKSDSLCHYYAKCAGSSSKIVSISKLSEARILEGADAEFFLTREQLAENTLQWLQWMIKNIQSESAKAIKESS